MIHSKSLNSAALVVAAVTSLGASAQDATRTDGDKYKVLLENEQVRVLEYRDLPGAKTHQHRHPAFVLYALAPFKRRLVLPDGKVLIREFKAGDVLYSPEQTHVGENIGTTPTHVLMVEMKAPPQARETKD
jgi:beta-alanine degradation protein BauB